jgi:transcriptional regulator with XRE-family HTH domain
VRASADSAILLTPQQAARVTEAFRAAVTRAGSQRALSEALGVSQQAVSEACRGRPSLGLAALLSMWLGVGVRDVLCDLDVSAVPVVPPKAAHARCLLLAVDAAAPDCRAAVLEGALEATWREGWESRRNRGEG